MFKFITRTTVVAGLFVGSAAIGVGANALVASPERTPAPQAISTGAEAHFVPISSFRAYDSRVVGERIKVVRNAESDLWTDLNYPVYVFSRHDGSGGQLIPDEATAVTYNVTVDQTESAGFVQIDTFAYADGGTSTVNWSGPGQTVANSGVAMVGSAFDDWGVLGIWVDGLAGARAHIILDITGYYVAANP